eukprot:CAMPEP_0115305482 /NCGR_PEP_ID=MMETSP0270-20121206/72049_1 /TAXON_ID=71861 /ORGANISM="Scrippsiella trochoidea, Strain CCMP3099" /LENGTH=102 /DNA_ID=CAMNT_0002723697 /DNA_START=35 /DNA_END=343 /DNA_ORIENTATION=-
MRPPVRNGGTSGLVLAGGCCEGGREDSPANMPACCQATASTVFPDLPPLELFLRPEAKIGAVTSVDTEAPIEQASAPPSHLRASATDGLSFWKSAYGSPTAK